MSKLIIDLLSDTHGSHEHFKCEGGDILIHAGDFCTHGTLRDALPFLDWYAEQDYSHLILSPGNHDLIFEEEPALMKSECDARDIILLNDSGVTVDGISIWGSPVQPFFCNWAFNRRRDEIQKHWDMIPEGTELLVTHGPAKRVLDYIPPRYMSGQAGVHAGCQYLLERLNTIGVQCHVFGHLHPSRGILHKHNRLNVNASCLNDMYCPVSDKPIMIFREILQNKEIYYWSVEC